MAIEAILACDGCFAGLPAILSLILAIVLLIGSIYMLIASNLGARVGYLVTMTSLFAFMIILSLLWLIGAPGTTTGTGPRGREPGWVPFTQDSAVAQQDFPEAVRDFPSGWDQPGEVYPGRIDSNGEFQTVSTAVKTALANEARVEGLEADEASDWNFRLKGPALTPAERQVPVGEVRYRFEANRVLFGVTIPATDTHRQVTVFAFRDKGLVYLYALYFLGISVLGFVGHLWLLARVERKQLDQEAALERETVSAGT